jgi:hypothetical protein
MLAQKLLCSMELLIDLFTYLVEQLVGYLVVQSVIS